MIKAALQMSVIIAVIVSMVLIASWHANIDKAMQHNAATQVQIGSVYLLDFGDTTNPYYQQSYDTVTVVDTCRGWLLYVDTYGDEHSLTIKTFGKNSKLYQKNGGYKP